MEIMIGMILPFRVLLLDKITTSIDICVRQYLLHWFIKESNERGATILYAKQFLMELMIGQHIFTTLHMRENVDGKAISKTWISIKNRRMKITPPKC